MFRPCCFSLTTILLAVLLTACSTSGKQWDPDDYTVKSGDTVYSISWRYELDPEEFAAWNDLGSSNIIKAGQRLHTRKPANFKAAKRYADNDASEMDDAPRSIASRSSGLASGYSNQKHIKAAKGDTLYGISKQTGVSVKRLAQLNQLKKPYVIQPGQTIFLKPLNTTTASGKNKSTRKTVASRATKKVESPQHKSKSRQSATVSWPKTVRWQRPAKGKVVKKFNRRKINAKGIAIAGKQGDAVVASADGKVVYSGNGLISYGNLIIIKHNKTYLSAYAYNRKLIVKEGDAVKAGQKIAEMGRKDNQSPRLHFEIRKNGKPVDPLKYIPW